MYIRNTTLRLTPVQKKFLCFVENRRVMGLFNRTVSDEQWLAMVKPLYEESMPVMVALDKLVANAPLPDDGDKVLRYAPNKLSPISDSLKGSPNPTSSEALQAKKNMQSATKNYIKGTKDGLAFYRGMSGKMGNIYRSGVGLNKLAEATLGGVLRNFLESTKSAQRAMEKANAYFSTHL